jgi:hypothetical protein
MTQKLKKNVSTGTPSSNAPGKRAPVDLPEGWEEAGGEAHFFTFENVGDKVAGEVLELARRDSRFKKDQLIVTLKASDGDLVLVGCSTKLDQLVTRAQVKVRDAVMVQREPDVDVGKGNAMRDFRLFIRRAPAPDTSGDPELPF